MIDMDKYHRLHGKHSNIPECCIEWWLCKWPNIFQNHAKSLTHRLRTMDVERDIEKTYNYIPCPACLLKKHWQKLHECTRKKCTKFRKQLKKKAGHTFPWEEHH